jgi:hypothetical protein
MPIDPMIARGIPQPNPANALAGIAALRQRDQALAQDAQQNSLMQQRFDRASTIQENALAAEEKRAMREQAGPILYQAAKAGDPRAMEIARAMAIEDFPQLAEMPPEVANQAIMQGLERTYGQQEKPDYRTVGGALVEITPDGPQEVYRPSQRAPLRAGGGSQSGPAQPVIGGESPAVPGEDPRITLAREKARATAAGRVEGQNQAQASSDLSRVEMNANNMRGTLKQLKESKGLRYLFGGYSLSPIVPGTPQADANAIWEQVQGKAFLEAFGTLKGGGQITEKEGEKATAAITRLSNRRQSLASALGAIKDLEDVVASAEDNARKKSIGAPQQSGANPVSGQTVIRNKQTGERRVWIETEKGGVWQEIK